MVSAVSSVSMSGAPWSVGSRKSAGNGALTAGWAVLASHGLANKIVFAMLLKVSLIIAILASIGTLVLSHLQVAEKVRIVQDDLQNTRTELEASQKEASDAKRDFRKAKEEGEKLAKELTETQSNLESAMSNWKTQQDRADKLEGANKQLTTDLVDTTRDLAAWKNLNIPLDQIRSRLADADSIKAANEALTEEKKLMARKIADQQRRLDLYERDKEAVVVLPPMKGEVLAVDPQWDFVIINLGENQGVKERGELLVSRDGKLVAKIRVARVEADRSIANVLPEWKQADVSQGDMVLN